jgi:hypothetical protein
MQCHYIQVTYVDWCNVSSRHVRAAARGYELTHGSDLHHCLLKRHYRLRRGGRRAKEVIVSISILSRVSLGMAEK